MIIFLGLAGSGKSTQSKLLAQRLNCQWLSTGQLLRERVTDKNIQKRMLEGEVLGDDLMLPLLEEELKKLSAHEFILDGTPRTLSQAKWLVDKINHSEIGLTAVVHLQASKVVVKKRLMARGRPDDTPAAISERFREYEKTIIPILNYFKTKNYPVYEVDGEKSPDSVDRVILEKLGLKE